MIKGKIEGIGTLLLFLVFMLIVAALAAAIAPALLCLAGVEYRSIIMLLVYIVIVFLSSDVVKAVISCMYSMAMRKQEEVDMQSVGHLIFDIVVTYCMVVLVDDAMEAVELSDVSAILFTLLYIFTFKVLDIIVDNICEEKEEEE